MDNGLSLSSSPPSLPTPAASAWLWFLVALEVRLQNSLEFKFKLKSIAQAFLSWRISKVFPSLTFAWCVDKALLRVACSHSTIVCRDGSTVNSTLYSGSPTRTQLDTFVIRSLSLALQRGSTGGTASGCGNGNRPKNVVINWQFAC